MKTSHLIKLLSLSVFSFLLIIGSCKKKDDGGDNPVDDPVEEFDYGTFTMKVNGNSWSSTNENNIAVKVDDSFSIISGNDNDFINLLLSPFPGEGTYQLNESSLYSALFSQSSTLNNYFSGEEGEVMISNYDPVAHRISGGFSFVGYVILDSTQSITISEGVFNSIPMVFAKDDQDGSIISFSLSGEPWVGDNGSTITVPASNQMQVVASENINSSSCILVFPYTLDPGTYSLSQDFTKQKFTYNAMGSESGSLTILVNDKVNHHIEGIFDCVVKDPFSAGTANISNGVFSFDY